MGSESKSRTKSRPRGESTEEVTVISEPEGPTMTPPSQGAGSEAGAVGLTEPEPLTRGQLAGASEVAVESRPSLAPPGGAQALAVEGISGVTGTWRSGVTVTALWSINEIRNAWMLVAGVGWRKLFNGRDAAFTALVAIASQARQTGRQVAFREENDGMVYEIYLW